MANVSRRVVVWCDLHGQVAGTSMESAMITRILIVMVVASVGGASFGQESEKDAHRTPQFPLKTDRVLFSDDEIQLARDNVAKYPAAKKLADGIVAAADAMLALPDQQVRDLIPTADVPRAFNVGTAGCPDCGKKIYRKGGTYPWIIDLEKPFKVQCPVCKELFPDNDFEAYYRSGFQDKQFLEGEYADNGWGWEGPDDKYWFVGYANHWTLHRHIVPGLGDLYRAYLLTGDVRYAHKAAVILDRIAEVYPAMEYNEQSRYAELQRARGSTYHGKLVNLIWACGNLTSMAAAYDAVWETIDEDTALQELTGKTGEQIRANIEANLLEEGIDCISSQRIRGNFGMHQRALAYTALVRQHGTTDDWLDSIFTQTGVAPLNTGLDYALYNLVYRDGTPYETSPGYNSIWFKALTTVAEALRKTEYSIYAMPKAKRLYDAPLEVINAGAFTPSLGDSGSVHGGMVTDARVFQAAYRAYGDDRYLAHLNERGAVGDTMFQSFESLFSAPIEATDQRPGPKASRLLDGYGMTLLNNPADTISVALYYGYKGGHGHFDRLGFEIFAYGQPIMPDLGYPDFMNGYVPGIYTWSKNTISHNTVTVDAGRQPVNRAGTVELFAGGPFARVVDVNALGTYPQCSTYRRCLVMIDVDADTSYFVDFFTVAGGNQHDYSLHGPPGACEIIGGTWSKQDKGTLAGEDVAVAEIYDDPRRGAPGYAGTYYSYVGSGFQHLFNVERLEEGDWLAQWTHERNEAARLRIRLLPEPNTEVILADAQISPVKHRELLKYVIARRTGKDVSSRFVSVLEPFPGEPLVRECRRVELNGAATAVLVAREGGQTDVVVYNPSGAEAEVPEFKIRTNAEVAVATVDETGSPLRVFHAGGAWLAVSEHRFDAAYTPHGVVVVANPEARSIRVRLTSGGEAFDPDSLVGRVVHFENDLRRTAHPIAAAVLDKGDLVLTTKDDLLVGRACLTAVEPEALRTNTAFVFAPVYDGTYVTDAGYSRLYPIENVTPPGSEDGSIRLAQPLPDDHVFAVGDDAWIVNAGPGDSLDIPQILNWEREALR